VKCLELGPSMEGRIGPEWVTMDAIHKRGCVKTDIIWDIGLRPWPVKSDTFDLVYSSHVLEHLTLRFALNAISEMRRVVKPGGAVEIFVPNFADIVMRYVAGGWTPREMNELVYNKGMNNLSVHKSCWDEEILMWAMKRARFSGFTFDVSPRGKAHEDSIGVRGIK
jgi:predicted SAM-dependent methyltransferase